MQNGRQKCKLGTWRRAGAIQTHPRTVSAPVSGCETQHDESTSDHLLDREVSLPRGAQHTMGCRGRAFGDCTGLTMACLQEEPTARKAGKGMDLHDLGRNKCEKTEE